MQERMKKIELWAGLECTVNRVGDTFFDQLRATGHDGRPEDIDLIHQLGIRTVRYPFLWERVAPDAPDRFDWSWADERLARFRALDVHPIAGLLHHGSGPAYTSLHDPQFPEHFARYAAAFAQRYPWVRDYTPINEPLTTARFSGLYGHWYPHEQNEPVFLTMLLHECRAICLAMQEIRRVNPAARLIQTEDMGKYWSTHALRFSADFLNERRWLSFDLLCGKVDEQHPLWHYILSHGITVAQLAFFQEFPCPPDIVGINYYITSERLVDEAFTEYPPAVRGDHVQHGYVDIEAVRTRVPIGIGPILEETWARYGIPIAVTEAHLNCTREEQLRWFAEIWETARSCAGKGVDVRAVTTWSVFGAHNWDKLLTCDGGCYESGLFDVRSPQPRPTALAQLVKSLANDQVFKHPALDNPGWWRRPERIFYPRPAYEEIGPSADMEHRLLQAAQPVRPLLITGASGTLGQAFARICDIRALDYHLLTRQQMDITNPVEVQNMLAELNPWAVINAAGYVRVDDAESDAERCYRENTTGPAVLAAACARYGCRLLTFSSDLVFSGQREKPWLESSVPAPLNVYGVSKARAETLVKAALPTALIIRTSAFFGPWDEHNFAWAVLQNLRCNRPFPASDAVVSPTYVPDLVNVSLDLLIDGETGIWHLANAGALTWTNFARRIAEAAGLNPALIVSSGLSVEAGRASHPVYSALGSERGHLMPGLQHALTRYLESVAFRGVLLSDVRS